MEKWKLITDKKEIEQLVDNFIGYLPNNQLIRNLTHLSKGNECRYHCHSFSFKKDFHECEQYMLQQPMTERTILVSASYPAVEEDCEAYVSFEEFYEYLEKSIHKALIRGYLKPEGREPYDKSEIHKLLKKCKVVFGLLSQQEYENEYGVEPEYIIVTDEREIEKRFRFLTKLRHNKLMEILVSFFMKEDVKKIERNLTIQFLEAKESDHNKESQVLMTVEYPTVLKSCKIYLSYETFYNHLEKTIYGDLGLGNKLDWFREWNELEIREVLKKIKASLLN